MSDLKNAATESVSDVAETDSDQTETESDQMQNKIYMSDLKNAYITFQYHLYNVRNIQLA